MKQSSLNKVLAVSLMVWAGYAQAGAFFGAGASFPKTAYQAWGKAYKAETGNVLIYTAVGSGKGLAEIVAARTDFGASDKPFSQAELEQNNLMQFPTLIGGVVPVLNVQGIADEQLQLDGAVLAAIYMGKITRWNDAAIKALNPSVSLPAEAIVVIHRDDKSGGTFVLSNYLSKVSSAWKSSLGEGFTLDWKNGNGVAGAAAMAQTVRSTPNAIGYMDFADMDKKHMASIKLRNAAGLFVAAEVPSFAAAASAAQWNMANGFNEVLTNQAGDKSWPMTSATFVLIERSPAVPENVAASLKFFDWAYRNGDVIAVDLGYVPLPDSVVALVRSAWKSEIKNRAGQSLF
ncbi:MAG: phosphate ABC transporter substrate-binding protein PstS [Sideroxydans sp.]|nr:phosphate ABC transporter substrate-binding protein PstS [Sideroxydans sp.]